MPRFQHIEYFILFAIIPVFIALFFLALAKKRATIKKLGDEVLVKALTKNYNPAAFLKKFILIVISFGILILALTNPRKPGGSQKVSRNGIDVMIALDVSKSMLAQDIKPSRLERAKQLLGRLVDKLSNDRIGIVVFAGKAYLQMPLTEDHSAAKMYLSAASTESVPTQGTVIGDALKMCYTSFNTKEKKYKAVILISDGEDHDEGAIKIATQIGAEGVVIYTIGIGSPQGAPIIDETTNEYKKDNAGNIVISKLNEDELKTIASKANGQYILFNNTEDVVENISSQINSMDQRSVSDDSLVNYKSYFQVFLAAALLLLIAEIFITEKKRMKKVVINNKAVFVLLFILSGHFAFAQNEKLIIKKGNEAYKKNDYQKALDHYNQAVQKNPANATAQFNLGNALYKTEKPDESIQAYDNALQQFNQPDQKSSAYYNKGVVLQNNKKLQECIDAYKNALKLEPGNEDARQNLQMALKQQKQQQQQQQDKEKDKDKDKKKQDQDKDKKKPEEKNDEPKPQPSKLTKQDAEEKLKALMQQEKNLQDKLHKINASTLNKPEKDW